MAKQAGMADLGCEQGETCEKPHSLSSDELAAATTTRTAMVTATRGQGDEEAQEEQQHMWREVSMSWQPLIGGACKEGRPITRLAAARFKAVCGGGRRREVGFIH